MKRLKNIEGKNEEQLNNQLRLVENNSANKESFKKLKFLNKIDQDAKESCIKAYNELEKYNKSDYNKLVCVHTNGKIYEFTIFRRLGESARNIYYGDISIKREKSRQDEIEGMLLDLNNYKLQKRNLKKNKLFIMKKKIFLKEK